MQLPNHQHDCVRAGCIANLDSDRNSASGNSHWYASVDLQNTLHRTRRGSGIKDLGGLIVDEHQYRKDRLWKRQVRSDFAIFTGRIGLSTTGGVEGDDGTGVGGIVPVIRIIVLIQDCALAAA